MIPIDRQTLTLLAVIVCMVGLVVMFRELKTAKEDVEGLKGFSMNVMKHMQPAPAPAVAAPASAPTPAPASEPSKENSTDNSKIANVQQ
jgi:hypothetical protein